MPSIHILPRDLADKIAAGEVVERPASVVKELVENSLDAGSTEIRVEIRRAGQELIAVSDNGAGMTAEEASLAIQRHATSKIATLEDLFCIRTLGFRGEALPSIASVSELIVETKPHGKEFLEGSHLKVRGGEVLETRAAGCPAGTKIEVGNLFYNTPARKKFLKSDGVEVGHIDDVLIRLALSAGHCGFSFFVDGKEKWSAPVSKDPLQRVKDCLGASFIEDAIPICEETPEFKLSGWILHPRQSAGNPQSIYFYLNGRFLRDRVLQHALGEGFSDFLMKGQYPKGVLYLEMNPREFDVNVHPAKREVRFVKPQIVHQFVAKAVRKILQNKIYSASTAGPLMDEEVGEPLSKNRGSFWGFHPQNGPSGLALPISSAPPTPRVGLNPRNERQGSGRFFSIGSPTSSFLNGSFAQLKVLGSIAQTYILCESPDHQLVLIDQHAAHERIGYEKLKKNFQGKGPVAQRLLAPLTWEASPKQAAVLSQHLGSFLEAGLEIEPFGSNTFAIKSVPALVKEKEIPGLLEKITEELEEVEGATSLQKTIEYVLKTIACHAQVRAGDSLSKEEMEHLLKEMDEYKATHCPHGRPTFVEISLGEIEEWFKRT